MEISSFQIIQWEWSYSCAIYLERPSFRNISRKYHISRYFFWEKSSFIFCLKNNMIFLGRRNIIFPDNRKKIIFQRDFFENTIFSEHLEIENMVFCAVWVVGKNTANKNSSFKRTKENRSLLVLYRGICSKKISRFIWNQEASAALRKLEIRFQLSNIQLIVD